MNDAPYEMNACLQDYRRPDLPLSSDLTKNIRARMYGILFFDKTSAIVRDEDWTNYTFRVAEYCAKKPDFSSLKTPEYVRPIVPPDCHPGLAALWEGKDDRNDRELRLAHGTFYK